MKSSFEADRSAGSQREANTLATKARSSNTFIPFATDGIEH